MFKELRKITLKSLPQGKDYIALVDNEKCIGCTQCVYYCNFASIDMISWDLKARTSQFESKKALPKPKEAVAQTARPGCWAGRSWATA